MKYYLEIQRHPKASTLKQSVIKVEGQPNFDFIVIKGLEQDYYANKILQMLNND